MEINVIENMFLMVLLGGMSFIFEYLCIYCFVNKDFYLKFVVVWIVKVKSSVLLNKV